MQPDSVCTRPTSDSDYRHPKADDRIDRAASKARAIRGSPLSLGDPGVFGDFQAVLYDRNPGRQWMTHTEAGEVTGVRFHIGHIVVGDIITWRRS